jgi:uncharacterized damage-inducible protein DinB
LKQAHEGEAWHGPSVAEALEGGRRRQRQAADRTGHSIWEIVHHVRVTEELVRTHLTGETAADEADWPRLTETGEAVWRAAVERLKATQRALREAVSKLPESRLHESVPGKSHSYWYELLGVVHHDLYHAGQISLLKKGVEA